MVVQRSWEEDLGESIGKDLDAYLATHPKDGAAHLVEVMRWLSAKYPDAEDNVAAEFITRQSDDQMEALAASADGLTALDLITEALLTGHVTAYETAMADRVLSAKAAHRGAQPFHAEVDRIARLRHRAEDSAGQLAVNVKAQQLAAALDEQLAKGQYRQVGAVFAEMDDWIEDNVASHLVELMSPARLQAMAADPAGLSLLYVLYDAVITGEVTPFERVQAERLLTARARAHPPTGAHLATLRNPPIFPLATSWGSTATLLAELLSGDRVRFTYESSTAMHADFPRETDTLIAHFGDAIFHGVTLPANQLIVVKLYDAGDPPGGARHPAARPLHPAEVRHPGQDQDGERAGRDRGVRRGRRAGDPRLGRHRGLRDQRRVAVHQRLPQGYREDRSGPGPSWTPGTSPRA